MYYHEIFNTEKIKLPCTCLKFVKGNMKNKKLDQKNIEKRFYDYKSDACHECGICAIPFFSDIGIDKIKIAGRELNLQQRIKDVTLIKKMLTYKNLPHKEFIAKAKELSKLIYGFYADRGCLYNF